MFSFFQARKLRYEIHVQRDDRWQIKEVVDDERDSLKRNFDRLDFQALEADVIQRAKDVLRDSRIQAVKVLRERSRQDGFATTQEIFSEASSLKPAETFAIGEYKGAIEPCTAVEQLYLRPSCRAIGVVLRSYLERYMVTPLEVLHHYSYIRKLEQNYQLRNAAVHHIGARQGGPEAAGLKARIDLLEKLIAAASNVAKAVWQESGRPKLVGDDIEALNKAVRSNFSGSAAKFRIGLAIADALLGTGFDGKAAALLRWRDGTEDPFLCGFLDEFVAGCLDSPQFVASLIGGQGSLSGALRALADLSRGQLPQKGRGPSEVAAPLAARLKNQEFPVTEAAIWERILREFERRTPVTHEDQAGEWNEVKRLAQFFDSTAPIAIRKSFQDAAQIRFQRLRQAS